MKSFLQFVTEGSKFPEADLPPVKKRSVNSEARRRNDQRPPKGFTPAQLADEAAQHRNPNKRLNLRKDRALA